MSDGALALLLGRAHQHATEPSPAKTLKCASSRFLQRRRFQRWWVFGSLRFIFRLIGRKIFLVHVDDFHFRSELAIAAEKNFIARLLSLALIAISQLYHGARGQQMRLFVNRHPIVIDRLAGGGDRKAPLDLSTDIFQAQHAIIFAIDPDATAITGNSLLLDRSTFAPPERLM